MHVRFVGSFDRGVVEEELVKWVVNGLLKDSRKKVPYCEGFRPSLRFWSIIHQICFFKKASFQWVKQKERAHKGKGDIYQTTNNCKQWQGFHSFELKPWLSGAFSSFRAEVISMLKKRSRVASSKQGLMSDHPSLPSPTAKFNRHTSSLFPSPRLFVGFSAKGISDPEAVMSPTSILETKPFSAIGNPFFADRNNTRKPIPDSTSSSENKHHPWESGDSGPVGLGIVDALKDKEIDTGSTKPESRMVLFGSQLKIQIPPIFPTPISPTESIESSHSSIEFGIKTKNSQLGSVSPAGRSPMGSANLALENLVSPRVFTGSLSASEMELSEDYTCVISHGPNPRTTHIFDNYIVESCGDGFSMLRKETGFSTDRHEYPSENFLSFCHACKKNLGQGKDIYMYRGEKAFCSRECRYKEMMFDEGMEKCPQDDLQF